MQKCVMQWVRMHPSIAKHIIHIPNEGKRSYNTGKLLKAMGMRAGVSDLFIAFASHGYHGAWLELKTEKGRISEHQHIFMQDMQDAGYFTAVCRSFDETVDRIRWYFGVS